MAHIADTFHHLVSKLLLSAYYVRGTRSAWMGMTWTTFLQNSTPHFIKSFYIYFILLIYYIDRDCCKVIFKKLWIGAQEILTVGMNEQTIPVWLPVGISPQSDQTPRSPLRLGSCQECLECGTLAELSSFLTHFWVVQLPGQKEQWQKMWEPHISPEDCLWPLPELGHTSSSLPTPDPKSSGLFPKWENRAWKDFSPNHL